MIQAGPSYQIFHFTDVPSVEIVLINQPTQPALGAGEPVTEAMPAVIGNAIYNATGVRLRNLPFTPANVLAALPGQLVVLSGPRREVMRRRGGCDHSVGASAFQATVDAAVYRIVREALRNMARHIAAGTPRRPARRPATRQADCLICDRAATPCTCRQDSRIAYDSSPSWLRGIHRPRLCWLLCRRLYSASRSRMACAMVCGLGTTAASSGGLYGVGVKAPFSRGSARPGRRSPAPPPGPRSPRRRRTGRRPRRRSAAGPSCAPMPGSCRCPAARRVRGSITSTEMPFPGQALAGASASGAPSSRAPRR